MALVDFIPSYVLGILAYSASYLALKCGFSLPMFSLNGETFGHVVITNVGTLGYLSAAAPLVPGLHNMGTACMGNIEKRPVVNKETGNIEVANMCTIITTGDSRYGDAGAM